MSRPAVTPRLLTAREAADYLNVPVAEVERLSFGRLRLGARVRYDRMALDHFLDDRMGLAPKVANQPLDEAEAALERFRSAQNHASGRS